MFVWREPLAHFVLGGGLIFLAYCCTPDANPDAIVITPAAAEETFKLRAETIGRPLTEAERSVALAELVEEELLVREALRQGVDRQDVVIRSRLADKMRFLLAGEPPAPTPEQLRAYLRANRQRFLTRPQVSFEQVFFARPAARALPDLAALRAELRRGADFTKLGDRATLGSTVSAINEEQLAAPFGAEFARQVFALRSGDWSGPLESKRGLHFVRVISRQAPTLPAFEELEPALKRQWAADQREGNLKRGIAGIRRHYIVRLP
jgi:hypothetical protein